MKYIFYSSVIFLFYTHHAFSECELISYPEIIKLNKKLDQSVIKTSTCSEKINQEFINFIESTSGSLQSTHLQAIFKAENNFELNLKPEIIKVIPIAEKLETLLPIGEDKILTQITSLYDKASIQKESHESVTAFCNHCDKAGQKNIKLLIKQKTIWLTGQLFLKRIGFVAKEEINPFNIALNRNQFLTKTFYDDGKSQLFKDIEQIHFYKTNKMVKKGQVLKETDLSPIALVKPGQRIKVILKSENISLESSALARSSGKVGDFIEVYNTKTHKKVTAQVIDFNTVMVRL